MADIDTLTGQLRQADRVRLFLDYDGTLANFAPTPDVILPDPALLDLLGRLRDDPRLRVAVVSGRRLSHIEKLTPPGLLLAATYGLEIRTPAGERVDRLAFDEVRPALERVKPLWASLVDGGEGFYLEDKGWALAIHARYAEPGAAGRLLDAAREQATSLIDADMFRLRGGDRFLEVAPRLANKADAVRYLLEAYPWPGATPVYVGDDDKDEDAFEVINAAGGVAVVVAAEPRPTAAAYRLKNPHAVRRWLAGLLRDD